eukprot:46859_1
MNGYNGGAELRTIHWVECYCFTKHSSAMNKKAGDYCVHFVNSSSREEESQTFKQKPNLKFVIISRHATGRTANPSTAINIRYQSHPTRFNGSVHICVYTATIIAFDHTISW